jgi:hypothetical protein
LCLGSQAAIEIEAVVQLPLGGIRGPIEMFSFIYTLRNRSDRHVVVVVDLALALPDFPRLSAFSVGVSHFCFWVIKNEKAVRSKSNITET